MKTQALLDALKKQIDELAVRVAPIKDHEFSHSRFDMQLFSHKSTKLGDCQKELNTLYQQLCNSVTLNHTQQVTFLTEKSSIRCKRFLASFQHKDYVKRRFLSDKKGTS